MYMLVGWTVVEGGGGVMLFSLNRHNRHYCHNQTLSYIVIIYDINEHYRHNHVKCQINIRVSGYLTTPSKMEHTLILFQYWLMYTIHTDKACIKLATLKFRRFQFITKVNKHYSLRDISYA